MNNEINRNEFYNIKTEHFKSILLPNIQNDEILNIYLFYRENNFVTDKKFDTYLKKLDFKKMIYKLFGILDTYEDFYLDNIQKLIKHFDYNSFNQSEQQKLKWLLYDCKNSNGNLINDEIDKNYIDKSTLYVYFTDTRIQKKLENKLKSKYSLAFYKNRGSTKKYLKLVLNKNNSIYDKFHTFVISNGDCEKYNIKKDDVIDHIQKPPSYFYDFNYWNNLNVISRKFQIVENIKNEKEYDKEYTNLIKDIIYIKVIESWKSSNRLSDEIYQPQFNNCYYNLKE